MVAEGAFTPAGWLSADVFVGVRFVNAPATPRGRIAPRLCVQRHVPRQETEGPRGRPCRDARRSVLCVRGEWRCRDLRDLLRTPPSCDASRTHAPPRQCGNEGSLPSALLRCPLATSLAPSPSAI